IDKIWKLRPQETGGNFEDGTARKLGAALVSFEERRVWASYIPCLSLVCWVTATSEPNLAPHFAQENCPAPLVAPTLTVFIMAPPIAIMAPRLPGLSPQAELYGVCSSSKGSPKFRGLRRVLPLPVRVWAFSFSVSADSVMFLI